MKDNFFLDSNICLYLFDDDGNKKDIAFELLHLKPKILTQVINENINILLKKFKQFSFDDITRHVHFLINCSEVILVKEETILKAMALKARYQLQWYDSLIIAAALQAGCTTLYSEDMQHNLVVEKHLTIVNPFL